MLVLEIVAGYWAFCLICWPIYTFLRGPFYHDRDSDFHQHFFYGALVCFVLLVVWFFTLPRQESASDNSYRGDATCCFGIATLFGIPLAAVLALGLAMAVIIWVPTFVSIPYFLFLRIFNLD